MKIPVIVISPVVYTNNMCNKRDTKQLRKYNPNNETKIAKILKNLRHFFNIYNTFKL